MLSCWKGCLSSIMCSAFFISASCNMSPPRTSALQELGPQAAFFRTDAMSHMAK